MVDSATSPCDTAGVDVATKSMISILVYTLQIKYHTVLGDSESGYVYHTVLGDSESGYVYHTVLGDSEWAMSTIPHCTW